MHRWTSLMLLLAASCGPRAEGDNQVAAEPAKVPAAAATVPVTLTRLDCGSVLVKDFSKTFSDRQLYPHGPKTLTDSCYLVTHDGHQMIWDTGLSAELKGGKMDLGDMVVSLESTLPEQLAKVGLQPTDIDVVGISHMHADHTGQAAAFPQAKLVIGKADFEQTAGKDDPFGPWRGEGKQVTLASSDVDIFGDGSVVALHLPGHTPDHLALLVRLASGPVMLSGDLYHAREARELRGVPGFNSDRNQTLDSMQRFEAMAKRLNAKVIIQHEAKDIGQLPAFPQAAK